LDKRQKQVIEAFLRMQRFLAAYVAMLPANYARAKGVFDEVIARLTDLSVAQLEGMRQSAGEAKKLEALIASLRDDHLWPLVTTARMHAAEIPGIDQVLKVPGAAAAPLFQIAAAKQLREAARPYAEKFVTFGLEPDFMEQLTAAIDAADAALSGRAVKTGTHVGARAGIEKELQRGRQAVSALDRYVRKALKGNTVALAEWQAAKRIKAIPTKAEDETKAAQPAA
jgi:hypothetical protein